MAVVGVDVEGVVGADVEGVVGADVAAVAGADVMAVVGEGEVGGGQGVSNGRTSVTCKVGGSIPEVTCSLPGTAPESRVPMTVAAKPAV